MLCLKEYAHVAEVWHNTEELFSEEQFMMIQTALSATVRIEIDADIAAVWNALTNPDYIRLYLFGTTTLSEWKVGSPITFRGVWEGKEYEDKGVILAMDEPVLFRYSYWSSFSGTDDIPENYAIISYNLYWRKNGTLLLLRQENIRSEKAREHSEQSWGMILKKLKELVEQEHHTL